MSTLSEANAKYALDLFHRLCEEHPCDNILCSPANATCALGLLAFASGCEQEEEIKKVLHWDEVEECAKPKNRRFLQTARHFGTSTNRLKAKEQQESCPKQRPCPQTTAPRPSPCQQPRPVCPRPRPCPEPEEEPCPERCVPDYECECPEGVHTEFSKILAALHAPSTNYTLSFANKLYGDHSISFIQKFIYCALKLYRTDVAVTDIKNAPEEVRRNINLWVEVMTHGKIKDLLHKGSFDCHAQLLDINAQYFKGQWLTKFDEQLTAEAPFYAHDADERDCQTVLLMNRKGVYNTATVDICDVEVQVLELPYQENEMSLFALLPTDCSAEALQKLEESLTYEHLLDWSCDLKPAEVNVYFPKFALERSVYVAEYFDLENLSDPEKADFSRATTTEKVALSQLVHDTLIEISEEGGEEAEARHCPRDRRQRQECLEFVPDHPFLYFIRHNPTQSIICIGRFAKPE